MNLSKIAFSALIISSTLLISCSDPETEEESTTTTESCGDYTYTSEVKELIDLNCATSGCHGGSVSPNLTTYSNVNAKLDRIKARAVDAKTMPKNGTLTESQIEILSCWIDKGGKE